MLRSFFSLRRRVAKLERIVLDWNQKKKLANCNCRQATVASSLDVEQFEAQMNLPCPAHGARRLGCIVVIEHIAQPDGKNQMASLQQLLEEYRARSVCAMFSQLGKH